MFHRSIKRLSLRLPISIPFSQRGSANAPVPPLTKNKHSTTDLISEEWSKNIFMMIFKNCITLTQP